MLLHDYLAFHAQSRSSYSFSRFEGKELNYGQAWERSGRLASMLTDLGIGPGVRFGLLMRNSPNVLLLIYAASRCGAVPVPLNHRLAPREWAWILEDAGVASIIADPEFIAGCDEVLPRSLKRISSAEEQDGWVSLQALMREGDPSGPLHQPDESDVLIQMYTSGTTGQPKGAMLTQRSIIANLNQMMIAMPYKINPTERSLIVLPLFHIAAIVTALGAISSGASLVIHQDVDPRAIVKTLVEDEITVATLVPSVIQFLLVSVPGIEKLSFPDLKLLGYGASPIAESVLRKALSVFNCRFVQGYGMTELSGTCCMLTEADHHAALADRPELLLSTGKPLPGTQVRIVDSEGRDLPVDEVGEIIVRGPQVMSGYWGLPEATQTTLVDGWLHTGDAGYLDDTGYLFIRDRVKDMIVSGGENIYPAEIEAVLISHPQVADVAVIGVPDDKWGETVMAVIVANNGVPAIDDLDRYCRQVLGGFKVPRRYDLIESLPRNGAGKILKRELRSIYWPTEGRQVG